MLCGLRLVWREFFSEIFLELSIRNQYEQKIILDKRLFSAIIAFALNVARPNGCKRLSMEPEHRLYARVLEQVDRHV